ncbi:unnamed protein product, partial [Amoebophrya sp. A120]|eukprot:GSA120T00010798001.1
MHINTESEAIKKTKMVVLSIERRWKDYLASPERVKAALKKKYAAEFRETVKDDDDGKKLLAFNDKCLIRHLWLSDELSDPAKRASLLKSTASEESMIIYDGHMRCLVATGRTARRLADHKAPLAGVPDDLKSLTAKKLDSWFRRNGMMDGIINIEKTKMSNFVEPRVVVVFEIVNINEPYLETFPNLDAPVSPRPRITVESQDDTVTFAELGFCRTKHMLVRDIRLLGNSSLEMLHIPLLGEGQAFPRAERKNDVFEEVVAARSSDEPMPEVLVKSSLAANGKEERLHKNDFVEIHSLGKAEELNGRGAFVDALTFPDNAEKVTIRIPQLNDKRVGILPKNLRLLCLQLGDVLKSGTAQVDPTVEQRGEPHPQPERGRMELIAAVPAFEDVARTSDP